MKNIRTVISPLLTVLCLCGFGVFEYPQKQPRFYLTIFYILISWLFYAYIIFRTRLFLQRNELDFPIYIHTNMIFAILYMLFNFYYNKKFKSCLDKLDIVNNTLEKLEISKNCARLRTQIIRLIIIWIVSILLININDYLWCRKHVPKSYAIMAICVPSIANYPVHINTLYDFMYITLLRYIGSQFEQINEYIQKLEKHKKQRVRCAWTISISPMTHQYMADIEPFKQNIWILMHIHLDLCSILRELNTIFGMQMVMQAVAFHVFTVQIIYECYITMMALYDNFTYEKLVDFSCICFWIIINTIKIIIFNYICEKVCVKIMQFSFQILRKPLQISGLGLFYFGFKFLLECVNFIAMVLVFVIQSPPTESSYIGAEIRKVF